MNFRFVVILVWLIASTGCGQKGPLKLPTQPQSAPAPASPDLPATSDRKK